MTLGSHLSWHLSRETMAWLVWQCWHFSFPLWHWDQQEQIPFVTTRASSITGCQTLQFYTRGPRRVSLIWGVIWTRGPLRVSPISRVIWRTLMAVCHYISFATVIPGAWHAYVHKGKQKTIRLQDQRSKIMTLISLQWQAMDAEALVSLKT